jgi:translation initiation factor eIF-2B subunit alpha
LCISRGRRFVANACKSRACIAELGTNFILDGMVILTHGRSRVVSTLLLKAAETKNFSVVVSEGRPDCSGSWLASDRHVAGTHGGGA